MDKNGQNKIEMTMYYCYMKFTNNMKRIIYLVLVGFLSFNTTFAQTPKAKLPFVGTRYFNFMGGNMTGREIVIFKNGTCIINDANAHGNSTIFYKGVFKNTIMTYLEDENGNMVFNEGYLFKGNKVYLLNKNGKLEKDCMGDGKACVSSLDK